MNMSIDNVIETAIRRDRVLVLIALIAVIVISWSYILAGAGMSMTAAEMTSMAAGGGMAKMMPAIWDIGHAILMFFMWWIMMVAMMLPSATPMVLVFAAINRKQKEQGHSYVATALFASAYLIVWAAFSIVAVALQWTLESLALLSPMLISASVVLSGSLLLAAGIYQLTPIKQVCLKNCRSPLQFMLMRWRNGRDGAFYMGVEHGAYCVGCCWFLMGLLFFGGVMNLYWIMGLSVVVLIEKIAPGGRWISYILGIGLIIFGSIVLAGTI